MSTPKQLAIRALENMRGDDLARARHQFRGRTEHQLAEMQFGASDRTCLEVLREYEQRYAEITAAIAWLNSLPT